jgi:putative DNA primase/helicase
MLPELAEQAHNRWRSILPLLNVPKNLLNGKNQPCPSCHGKDRFRFTDVGGSGGYFCSGCGHGDGVDLLRLVHGWDFPTIAKEVRGKLGVSSEQAKPVMDEDRRLAMIRAMWDSASPITEDDDAGRYLASRFNKWPYPKALRFLRNCRIDQGTMPAMLARVHGPDGKPLTIHRTFLQDGEKASIPSPKRLMPGETPLGSYVPLYSPRDGELGVAEGIETALAVTRNFGTPCWSCISADGLAAFTPPPGITRLIIYGDNDLNFVGQAASYKLASRMKVRKDPIDFVGVHEASIPGKDWADYKYGPANWADVDRSLGPLVNNGVDGRKGVG